ncbi:ataxin-1 [Oncorhynchus tshawytscha]|uniref:AXH domain-containing protein n=1 Tax=Oncorhynchus tshawytscha TaxID=74940 RepID=A0AAZ3SDD9_ONCTS|nr:ataxin-1 [Oncorhynchus tshawytscha]XP_042172876.1 ataxin-1 [Oncorhynchus tshawytscha]XP_042172877.1 ataxin-1 [Oncorhynchus tshawytscha]XP_042172878.1 ataxin-1 [Oncorhynchus tshawytscha]
MKSNQERSHGCLPPKKREILALEQRPVVVTAAAEILALEQRPVVVPAAAEILALEQRPVVVTAAAEILALEQRPVVVPAAAEILALEQRPVVVTAAAEIQALEQRPVVVPAAAAASADTTLHTENLAWLANVASERCRSTETPSPRFHVSSSSSSSPSALPLSSLSTIYPTGVGLSQQGGTIQYAQLAPNLQFISSGPYTGYISSQIIQSTATSVAASTGQQRHHLDGHCYTTALISQATKVGDQQNQVQIGLPSDLAVSVGGTHFTTTHQYIQLDSSSPLTVTSPTQGHLQPLQLHTHPGVGLLPHTLTLAPSQVLVQYTDGLGVNKAEGGHTKVVQLNGELERSFGKQSCAGIKGTSYSNQNNQQVHHGYEARHILIPADYTTQDSTGLQTSLVLVANAQPNPHPNPHPTSGAEQDKVQVHPSPIHSEGGGICLRKPVSRTSSFTSLNSSEALKVSSAPHTVIQTTHHSDEHVHSLYSTTQAPIIGYIARAGNQHGVSYATLPQHLVIPDGQSLQSLLIPVNGVTTTTDLEAACSVTARTASTTASQLAPATASLPRHTYLTASLSKCEMLGSDGHHQSPAVLQAQVLPIQHIQIPSNTPANVVASPSPALAIVPGPVQASPSLSSSPSPAPALAPGPVQASPSLSSSPTTLPPFFMRGSIIQLADGELKRVEDLKTEDFIQSAEISSELKIDSSTVERIDTGQTPNAVIIQFGVGEHKAQVCVEVLLEYPFFVFGQGWSSCCPDRTTQLLELSCAKLCVGDVCVSLTLRSLRGGSGSVSGRNHNSQGHEVKLRHSHNTGDITQGSNRQGNSQGNSQSNGQSNGQRDGQSMDKDFRNSLNAAGSNSVFLVQVAKTDRLNKEDRDVPRCVDQVTGSGLRPGSGPGVYGIRVGPRSTSDLQAVSGNGEMIGRDNGEMREREQNSPMLPLPLKTEVGEADKEKPWGRKRRWSAPERDQTERADEEPPLTLPKPSFITQQVKLSIEGRSKVSR